MKRSVYFTLVVVLGLVAVVISRQPGRAADTTKPTDGWTLHIDAKLHFPGKP